jgi:hypothetical protein
MEKLTDVQRDLILGSLMGDAGIAKRGNSYRARFAHSEKQRNYLEWKKEILSSVVSMNTLNLVDRQGNKTYNACSFTTLSSHEFKEFYDLFYVNGVKTITDKLLNSLNLFSLAIWYMDDGCLNKDIDSRYGDPKVRYRITFALGKVSSEEAKLVQVYFKNVWALDSWVIRGYNKEYNRDYPSIKLSYFGTRKFLEIIDMIIPECMKYKLHRIPVTTTR